VFFVLSKVLDLFLSPYTWGLLLLAAAVPWGRRSARTWRRRRLFGAAGLGVLLICSTEAVANGLVWHVEHSYVSTYRDDVVYDAVVLLGGVVDEDATAESGQPAYNENVERVIMTHRLLRDGKAKVAIVSGAAMSPALVAYGEAVVLGHQLEDWGIAKDRIILEDKARNTHENALFVQRIAQARGLSRVLIVTSAFHMPRSVECFNAVGMKVDTMAVDWRGHDHRTDGLAGWLPRTRNLMVTTNMLREISGRYVYRVRGYAKSE
jgi:uncharacterized SAM-binding protein YcdF (DUF218 family)